MLKRQWIIVFMRPETRHVRRVGTEAHGINQAITFASDRMKTYGEDLREWEIIGATSTETPL